MIELDHLTKKFGDFTAVDDISLNVEKGEVLGFLGPNGAGKSTTMKMLTGYLVPSAGTARVCGHDVRKSPVKAKSHIGYLPEGAPAWADMTPDTFLNFAARIRGLSGGEAARAISAAIENTSLDTVLNQPIETLSKGFKRRVGLAQALLHNPDVLVLDEPTDGLDPNQKHDVRELIREISANKAIIVSTHILEEVEAVCSRAVIIDQGRVVANESPAELEARSERHNGVSVTVRPADLERAKSAISGVTGIAGMKNEGEGQLFITVQGRKPVAAEVAETLKAHGIAPIEFLVERGRLEEVFRTLTHSDTAETASAEQNS
ncbi:ABC transporter ATP-binding protein [Aestuariispira insulae]|uniref:ABC-2 type transport system ATP-binding protein n=1 Tax=Aestuariispira insulae TaxID=1461337 RepID=A0A3D9H7H1_9PROT|nr:ABC transporter ATP-binding protein [Aestuariispira insulae]RED45101.1 ABC-2 type transport system ATP-binding protein [Aestuariispira insulae]